MGLTKQIVEWVDVQASICTDGQEFELAQEYTLKIVQEALMSFCPFSSNTGYW